MLIASKDALRKALREAFPISDVPHLHEGAMPVGFLRPALYIEMMPWGPKQIATSLWDYTVRWQIVYFPREDAAGSAIPSDLFQAAAKFEAALGRVQVIKAPTGEPFHVEDFSLTERDDVAYATLALRGGLMREDPAATTLGSTELTMNLEEE